MEMVGFIYLKIQKEKPKCSRCLLWCYIMAIFFSFRARNVIFVPMQTQVQQDTLPRSGLWVSLAEGHCSL